MSKKRPYFLWDYDLSEQQVRNILRGKNETEKTWMLSRIVESARLEDVWKYTNLKKLKKAFPNLHLKKPIRTAWERAFDAWAKN